MSAETNAKQLGRSLIDASRSVDENIKSLEKTLCVLCEAYLETLAASIRASLRAFHPKKGPTPPTPPTTNVDTNDDSNNNWHEHASPSFSDISDLPIPDALTACLERVRRFAVAHARGICEDEENKKEEDDFCSDDDDSDSDFIYQGCFRNGNNDDDGNNTSDSDDDAIHFWCYTIPKKN